MNKENIKVDELHEHQFKVKFSQSEVKEYTVYCDQPGTVLQAIKTLDEYEKRPYHDKNIIIQMGKGDNECTIATHFPCSCIEDDEVLTISCESEIVEIAQPNLEIFTKDRYSIFYIDTKKNKIFNNYAVKQFKYVCVYAEKGITVEEALKKDGRFFDTLGYFELNENGNTRTECTQKVNKMDKKKFKICREPEKNTTNAHASVIALAKLERDSVKRKLRYGSPEDTNNFFKVVCSAQFQELENWFKSSRYKLLNDHMETFQQFSSDVHRVKELLELGKSVCKVTVNFDSKDNNFVVGTGFVVFDTFILTSALLFKGYIDDKILKQGVEVFAFFDYEGPEPEKCFYYFRAENTFIDFDENLGYAVLKLNPEGSKPNLQTRAKGIKVPPGLLSKFGLPPTNGEACIIGHPAGRVKTMDHACIIEPAKTANEKFKGLLIIQPISDYLINARKKGMEDIVFDVKRPEKENDCDCMYHGASGSPVFDDSGRLFGLHTARFTFIFTEETETLFQYGCSLIMIFEKFVSNLRKSENKKLLNKVKKEAKGNELLTNVLQTEQEE